MKLENLYAAEDLRGLYRLTSKQHEERSVHPADVPDALLEGWSILRKGKHRVRLSKQKDISVELPDRVWTLMYRLGFESLSGNGGSILECRTPDGSVKNQLDVVVLDSDVAIYFECRSSRQQRSVPRFAEDIAHIDGERKCFASAVRAQFGERKIGAIYWGFNQVFSSNDLQRAAEKNVRVFNERELSYYEDLVAQIGTAARFQFLADVFGTSRVSSLSIKVPAVRIKLGDSLCYSFAISPAKLLKIAYISHRAKGSPTDVDTYQRLLKRSRIRDIRGYVQAGGYFPTNIVINIRSRRGLVFDKAATPAGVDVSAGEIGWLTLPAEFKSAWVIDGQHRLFAYADNLAAEKAELTVLAFENLAESDQARLFIDINAKQKSVKQNLLVELFAELHWNSENLANRVSAIISKLILTMDSDANSPFFAKIVRADDSAASARSISLKALSNALDCSELFVAETKAGPVPGAFWQVDQMKTLRRAAQVIDMWFAICMSPVKENWELGKLPGGALGMNDSVVANVLLFRSILRHLNDEGVKMWELSTKELCSELTPWAERVAHIFSTFQPSDFALFRGLRGIQGQTQRYRELQLRLRALVPTFNPQGLDEYARSRDQDTIKEARELVDEVELTLQRKILATLKAVYGPEDKGWWYQGVPKQIRARIVSQLNEEASDDAKENRFNLIDYRAIVMDQWQLFKDILGQDKANASKDKRTLWLARVNEIRNRVSHASKGASATLDDVEFLRQQCTWLADSFRQYSLAPGMDDAETVLAD